MNAIAPSDTGAATRFLLNSLKPARPVTIADVGANPINEAPYSGLLKMGGCHVIGFEPQDDAFAALQAQKTPAETYFPFAVGTGGPVTLHIYRSSGMTSIFEPYMPSLRLLGKKGLGQVDRSVTMDTVALDQAADMPEFDLLKIDIQGGETLVFRGGEQRMKPCLAVIVELRYLQLYRDEPMMSGVDTELRRQGFTLHKFMFNKSMMLRNSQAHRLRPRRHADQLIDGDGVYLRDLTRIADYSSDQLMHLAVLACSVFASHSVVLHCLDELVARGDGSADLPGAYVDHLPADLRQA